MLRTRSREAHKEEKIKAEAQDLATKMAGLSITVGAKTSTSGKIFGSVNTIQIAEALKEKGFDIDRKSISLPEDQIKEIGKYKAVIRLAQGSEGGSGFRNCWQSKLILKLS
ncbi:MAG: 50S ribosomal protein L9 [Marinilabiliales bacterium]|nr:50S ribosomal protein L9 [Marinilabiliales bacterium]